MKNISQFQFKNRYFWDEFSQGRDDVTPAFFDGKFDHGTHFGVAMKDVSFEVVWFSASTFVGFTFENVDFSDVFWQGSVFKDVTFRGCRHNGRGIPDQTYSGSAYDFFENV